MKVKEKPEIADRITDLLEKKERNVVYMDELDSENWSIDQEMGELLRTARLKKGLGLRETARLIGISAPYLQDLEGGDRHISPEIIGKLLKYL